MKKDFTLALECLGRIWPSFRFEDVKTMYLMCLQALLLVYFWANKDEDEEGAAWMSVIFCFCQRAELIEMLWLTLMS